MSFAGLCAERNEGRLPLIELKRATLELAPRSDGPNSGTATRHRRGQSQRCDRWAGPSDGRPAPRSERAAGTLVLGRLGVGEVRGLEGDDVGAGEVALEVANVNVADRLDVDRLDLARRRRAGEAVRAAAVGARGARDAARAVASWRRQRGDGCSKPTVEGDEEREGVDWKLGEDEGLIDRRVREEEDLRGISGDRRLSAHEEQSAMQRRERVGLDAEDADPSAVSGERLDSTHLRRSDIVCWCTVRLAYVRRRARKSNAMITSLRVSSFSWPCTHRTAGDTKPTRTVVRNAKPTAAPELIRPWPDMAPPTRPGMVARATTPPRILLS